jgi:hypothetical protein
MHSHSRLPVIALAVGFLVGLAAPGIAQVPPGPPLPAPPPEDLVQFRPPNEALLQDMQQNLQVGQEYAGFDLCRGIPATSAPAGSLNASDSTCGDPLNPSATVRGGNPPYHFQLDTMGGFPPLGMWVDLNGVLRGKPTGTRGASFKVCAVDLSARHDCQYVTVPDPKPEVAADPQPEAAKRTKGGNGNKVLLAVVGGVAVAGAAVYAGSAMGQLAATTAGECYSTRNCIPNVLSAGCMCAGTLNAGCDWTGAVAGTGQACGAGMPCRAGLSCNNGRCEGSNGRCPF